MERSDANSRVSLAGRQLSEFGAETQNITFQLKIRETSRITCTSQEVARSRMLAMEGDARLTILQQNRSFHQAILDHNRRTRELLNKLLCSLQSIISRNCKIVYKKSSIQHEPHLSQRRRTIVRHLGAQAQEDLQSQMATTLYMTMCSSLDRISRRENSLQQHVRLEFRAPRSVGRKKSAHIRAGVSENSNDYGWARYGKSLMRATLNVVKVRAPR